MENFKKSNKQGVGKNRKINMRGGRLFGTREDPRKQGTKF